MIIELATFRLAPGVTDSEFMDVDARVQTEFAYQRPGLVRRTTARGSDGEWLVVTMWQSEDDAETAATAFADHPVTHDFRMLVDQSSYTTRRYATLD